MELSLKVLLSSGVVLIATLLPNKVLVILEARGDSRPGHETLGLWNARVGGLSMVGIGVSIILLIWKV